LLPRGVSRELDTPLLEVWRSTHPASGFDGSNAGLQARGFNREELPLIERLDAEKRVERLRIEGEPEVDSDRLIDILTREENHFSGIEIHDLTAESAGNGASVAFLRIPPGAEHAPARSHRCEKYSSPLPNRALFVIVRHEESTR